MATVAYYWKVLRQAVRASGATLWTNLRWEVAFVVAIGIVSVTFGATVSQAVLYPLLGLGVVVLLTFGGYWILAPVRMDQEHVGAIQVAQVVIDKASINAGLLELYERGLTDIERVIADSVVADQAVVTQFRAVVTDYYKRHSPGRAATWDKATYNTESMTHIFYHEGKSYEGDKATVCSQLYSLLQAIKQDVEFGIPGV